MRIKEKGLKKVIIKPKDVAEIMTAILKAEEETDREKEHTWVIGLNVKNEIKYIELNSLGILTQSIIHPREVFRLAILEGVNSIILVHNHPSGDPTPSKNDRKITDVLKEAGAIIGIALLDHVIITVEGDFYSFDQN